MLLLKDLLEPTNKTWDKIYKYMTSLSKNVYIDKLDDRVNEYCNTYHAKIKIKPTDVKRSTYIDLVWKIIITNLILKLVTSGVTDNQWRCAGCDRTALEKNGALFKEYKIKILLFVWSHFTTC